VANESAINVTVHTLKELLEAIPEQIPINFLKTDMQGHDLVAIKSAGNAIKRVSAVKSEVHKGNGTSYDGPDNSAESFGKYMKEMGFLEIGKTCEMHTFKKKEADCYFVRPPQSSAH